MGRWGCGVLIPVFVSSTFADFQRERDALRTVVEPRLDAELAPFGCRVELVDLRAGIASGPERTDASVDRDVLDVCVGEIQRARPLFLVLVGRRFGTVFDPEVRATALGPQGFAELADGERSITEIEVEVSLAELPTHARIVAVVRADDPSFPDAWRAGAEQADRLVARLKGDPRVEVVSVAWPLSPDGVGAGAAAFEEAAFTALRGSVVARAAELTGGLGGEAVTRGFRAERAPFIEAHDGTVATVMTALEKGSSVCLTGAPGVGTSTAWCAVLAACEERWPVRAAVAGGGRHDDPVVLLRELAGVASVRDGDRDLLDISALAAVSELQNADIFMTMRVRDAAWLLLAGLARGPDADPMVPTIVAVDAVDAAVPLAALGDALGPDRQPAHLRWLVTTGDPVVRDRLQQEGFRVVRVRPLAGEALRRAVEAGNAALAPRRQLPEAAATALAAAPRGAAWLAVALRRLLRPDRFDLESLPTDRARWQAELDAATVRMAEGLPAPLGALLGDVRGRLAQSLGTDAVDRVLALIGSSPFGVQRRHLLELAGVPAIEVVRVLDALRGGVEERGDRLVPAGPGRGLDRRPDSATPDVHRRLAELLRSGPAAGADAALGPVDAADLAWHLARAGEDPSPALNALGVLAVSGPASTRATTMRAGIELVLALSEGSEIPPLCGLDEDGVRLLLRLAGRLAGRSADERERALDVLARAVAAADRAEASALSSMVLTLLDVRATIFALMRDGSRTSLPVQAASKLLLALDLDREPSVLQEEAAFLASTLGWKLHGSNGFAELLDHAVELREDLVRRTRAGAAHTTRRHELLYTLWAIAAQQARDVPIDLLRRTRRRSIEVAREMLADDPGDTLAEWFLINSLREIPRAEGLQAGKDLERDVEDLDAALALHEQRCARPDASGEDLLALADDLCLRAQVEENRGGDPARILALSTRAVGLARRLVATCPVDHGLQALLASVLSVHCGVLHRHGGPKAAFEARTTLDEAVDVIDRLRTEAAARAGRDQVVRRSSCAKFLHRVARVVGGDGGMGDPRRAAGLLATAAEEWRFVAQRRLHTLDVPWWSAVVLQERADLLLEVARDPDTPDTAALLAETVQAATEAIDVVPMGIQQLPGQDPARLQARARAALVSARRLQAAVGEVDRRDVTIAADAADDLADSLLDGSIPRAERELLESALLGLQWLEGIRPSVGNAERRKRRANAAALLEVMVPQPPA